MNGPTEWDIHDLRHQGDLLRYLHAARARAGAECAHRRRLVLAHPDLAARLAELLLLASAQQWGGFVSPEREADGRPNRSPIRAGLVEIVAEAQAREGS